ncbi:DUF4167 domain-containing protein [Paracoccus aminovorans]|uniref:DUF4167 domain-containing protein n=1 Tax=Paracoccus aminovorans TaxID=34004 RepID=UPI002B25D379|nr:DUF4167 domain-containing protein [Paracoccus aminovorans]
MRSSKSRSRNKSNRQRSLGNIVNRVFDSSGPEGKVRGTPQQIIEKYLTLARDAQLSNDRVAEQSFLQHAEHYTRLLGEAQREQAERQQQHQGRDDDFQDGNGHAAQPENGNGQNGHGNRQDRHDRQDRHERQERRDDRREERSRDDRQPARVEPAAESGLPPVIASDEDAAGPVETPESAVASEAPAEAAPTAAAPADPAPELALEDPAEAAPAPRRRSRSAAPATPRAPRTRRKPAEGSEKASADKASSE